LGLILIFTSIIGCQPVEPDGVIRKIISPGRHFDNHLYYWETKNGKTAIFRIAETTSDIDCIVYDLERVRDVQSSANAVYILYDNSDGHLAVSRLEGNRAMVTDAVLDLELTALIEKPWAVSRNDKILLAGEDENGRSHVVELTFERTEAERTFRENEVLVPTVEYTQAEWYVTDEPVGLIGVSNEAEMIALTMPSETGGEPAALYFLYEAGGDAVMIEEGPVREFGGFSSDLKYFMMTIERSLRTDLYTVRLETNEAKAITRVAMDFHVEHADWHPNAKYIIYTTNYTTELFAESTPLSGDQIFLYSLVSANDRRLTAFREQKLWVDFSPAGGFLLYASAPGVVSRSGRGIPEPVDPDSDETDGFETWRMSFVPWNEDDFVTGNIRIMNSDELDLIATWTHGGATDIGFTWGPEMLGL